MPALRSACMLLATALLLSITGCDAPPNYEHTYTVRGVVTALPGDTPMGEFRVHHEPIPDYISINGTIGMREMDMAFAVPDREVLDGLKLGDKVEVTFGENIERNRDTGVISIKKLAPDVELNLSKLGAKPNTTNNDGFIPLFDGKTLDGWEGDLDYWSVQDGTIVGEITEDKPLKHNTFLIWRGGEVRDFELKLEYRISAGGNSGIQYRSQEEENFGMKGYQADIEHGPRWTGQCYDEGGRGFLAKRGESVVVEAGEKPKVVEQIGDADELMNKVDLDGWNEYRLVVKGNRFVHFINGVRMAEVVDNDEVEREMKGLLGLQLHSGQPVKVAFRTIQVRHFPHRP